MPEKSFKDTDRRKSIVWILCSNRWYSAITEYSLCSAKALSDLGYRVIYSPLDDSPADFKARELDVQLEAVRSFNLLDWRRIRGIAKEHQPDVLMTFGGKESVLTSLVVPNVRRFRFRGQNGDLTKRFETIRMIMSFWNQTIITPSKDLSKRIALGTGNKAFTVHLGRDSNSFGPCDRVDKGVNLASWRLAGRPEIQIFGRLDPVKGHREFLPVFKAFIDSFPIDDTVRPILHIIGKPVNMTAEDIYQVADKLGLDRGDLLITSTQVSDPSRLMAKAVLGVISSIDSEIICRVGKEYLLSGTPILVSGVGTLDKLIHSKFGWSWKGLNFNKKVELLRESYKTSLSESDEVRIQRSSRAASLYSLENMGRRLADVIALGAD